MSSAQTYAQWLSDRGVSLEQLGLREVALHQADALAAVELLQREARPILGGDVYFVRGDRLESAYANWHTDREAHESRDSYVARSCQHTRQYIASFPHRPDVTPVFVLVA